MVNALALALADIVRDIPERGGGDPDAPNGGAPVTVAPVSSGGGPVGPQAGDDPLAYADTGENMGKRYHQLERVVIDMFYGGRREQFYREAGIERPGA